MPAVPEETIAFSEVCASLESGDTFWAMRGDPVPGSFVEVFYASLDEDEGERFPGIDYVGGLWTSDNGEEDWFELNEAVERFGLPHLLWYRASRPIEFGLTCEHTVKALRGT